MCNTSLIHELGEVKGCQFSVTHNKMQTPETCFLKYISIWLQTAVLTQIYKAVWHLQKDTGTPLKIKMSK